MPLIISASCLSGEEPVSQLFDPVSFAKDKLIMVIDADRCIGCRACEIHCWNEHRLERETGETSVRILHLHTSSPDRDAFLGSYPYPHTCSHCEEPDCVKYCPAGAIKKEENGIVQVYRDKCIGCQTCSTICPNYFFTFSKSSGKTLICDGCFLRLKEGWWPACATKCSMKAIYIGYPDEIARILKEKMANGDQSYMIGNIREGEKACG
ncbi:MAG: 4Fe-4S binding protein [Clostridia bacterium]|nr:4Fe-4S binding protein [Clostridia bacterium]